MTNYPVTCQLYIEAEANSRYSDPSTKEIERAEAEGRPGTRVIGGDQGDLYFDSYVAHSNRTYLSGAVLRTSHDDLTNDEANCMADQILKEAFDAIGIECVEHS